MALTARAHDASVTEPDGSQTARVIGSGAKLNLGTRILVSGDTNWHAGGGFSRRLYVG